MTNYRRLSPPAATDHIPFAGKGLNYLPIASEPFLEDEIRKAEYNVPQSAESSRRFAHLSVELATTARLLRENIDQILDFVDKAARSFAYKWIVKHCWPTMEIALSIMRSAPSINTTTTILSIKMISGPNAGPRWSSRT